MKKTVIRFTVRKRGSGSSVAGKTLEREVPAFDWEDFKRCPNAAEFAQKTYIQALRKLVREEALQDASYPADSLYSMESVITNSLSYTKDEVIEWIESRDWEAANLKVPAEQAVKLLKNKLTRVTSINETEKDRLAEIIASVADNPDAIADYLFSKLTILSHKIEASDL